MENDQNTDPYEAVLADLRTQKERIETTIALLESLRDSGIPATVGKVRVSAAAPTKANEGGEEIGPGAFFGMTIHDATMKLLRTQRREMQTTEIVPELERGGIRLTSSDKPNTVGSILLRRFYNVGDIVRVGRGRWGLQEWYPGRKFPKGKPDDNHKDEGEEVPAVGNTQGTENERPRAGVAEWVENRVGRRLQDEGD